MTAQQQPSSTISVGTVGEIKHQLEATVSTTFELKASPPPPPPPPKEEKKVLVIAPARYPVHPGYDFANPVAQQMFWLLKHYEEKHQVTVICKEGSTFKDVIYFTVGINESVAAAEVKDMVKFDEYDLIVDFSDEKRSYLVAKEKKIQTLYIMNPQLEYRSPPPGLKHPCLVGVSNVHCSHLSAELGVPVRKLPFGYEPPADIPARDDKNYLLYFGKVVKEKGVHELITICKKRRIDLMIAGDDREGVEQNYVHRILEECDGDSIRYVGAVDENMKAKLIAEAHAVVVPYLTDFNAYGCLTARATTALKVPIIALDRGAVEEFIKPGVNGAYCRNIEELETFDFEHLTMTFDGFRSAPDYERFEQLVERALRSPW